MKKQYKWIGFALAMLMFLFYGFGVKKTTLANRAIVVGMAIDRVAEDLIISAQIIIPQKPGVSKKTNNVVSAKGKTISGAFNALSKETSMIIALSHCNLVVLGRAVFEIGAYNILDYLTRNAYLSENALLVCTMDKGVDVLKTKVAFSDMSSFYAQRTISGYGDYLGIAKINIKDFMLNYHSSGGANWLTILDKIEIDNSSKEEEKEYLFDLSNTAIIKKNKFVYVADKQGTEGLTYFYSKIQNGSIFLLGDNGESIELYIIKKTEKKKVDLDSLTLTLEIELTVVIKEIIKKDDSSDIPVEVDKLKDSETKRLIEKVAGTVTKIFTDCQKEGVDIFDIYGSFYRKYANSFKANHTVDDFIKKVKLETIVHIKFK